MKAWAWAERLSRASGATTVLAVACTVILVLGLGTAAVSSSSMVPKRIQHDVRVTVDVDGSVRIYTPGLADLKPIPEKLTVVGIPKQITIPVPVSVGGRTKHEVVCQGPCKPVVP